MKGWVTKKLGDVCERVTVGHVGITAPFYRDDGIMFLRTQNVGKTGLELDDVKYITQEFHASLKKSEVKAGDILMSRVITHTVNCALVPTGLGVANCANVVLVRPGKAFVPEFLAHYIRSPQAQKHLLDRKVGSAQLVVNTTVVKEWPVPLPPLSEQQRIVGVLDEAFAGLATVAAHAAQNLQNARALFESHLQAVFTQRGPGWVEKRFEHAVTEDCTLSYGIVQPGDETDGGLPVVRPTDLTRDIITLEGLKRIDPKRAESYQRTTLQGGELLMCVRGTTGVVSKADAELVGANVTRGIVPIRLRPELIGGDFAFHLLRSEPVQAQIKAKTYGAALMQINIGDLRQITLAFPPLSEQKTIGGQLDALSAETQRLAGLYERKQVALEALKKSLLHQAFAGEL